MDNSTSFRVAIKQTPHGDCPTRPEGSNQFCRSAICVNPVNSIYAGDVLIMPIAVSEN